ncbi:hypothetical protein BDC45DRAFT_501423 [Circinella umbellata]|nr:hypothetical protein BDC45DRAFT_501423 [Circinella umbellata]
MTTAIDQLTEENKNYKQGLGSNKTNKKIASNTRVCYNCQGEGHMASECPNPCKCCGGSHPHYKCDKYPKKQQTTSSALLITQTNNQEQEGTEDLFAIKRKQNSNHSNAEPPTKQRIKISDLKTSAKQPEKNKQINQLAEKSLHAKEIIDQQVYSSS